MTQVPLFEPASDWRAPELSSLPSWKGAQRVCIDIETRDPQLTDLGPGVRRDDSYIVGVSFAIQNGGPPETWPCHYLPIAHEAGGNLPREHVLQYLRDNALAYRGPGTTIAGANLGSYDLDFLEEENVLFQPERFRDITIAEPLLDENQFRYGLDAVAARYEIDGKDETHLASAARAYGWCKPKDVKAHLWQLPARHVGGYAEQDARLPLQLLQVQERKLAAPAYEGQSLWGVYELESQLIPAMLKMKRTGVAIDERRLEFVEAQGRRREADYMDEFSALVGQTVTPDDLGKKAMLGRLLVEQLGLPLPKTDSGRQYSIKAEVLAEFNHPAIVALRRAQSWNKMRTTYVGQVLRHLTNGRLHCTFNQLKREKEDGTNGGTVSGRISASNPSLQNQPARDEEIGPLWRSIYVPDEDGEWCVNDYSQQEPRWTVVMAEATNRVGAAEAADRYRDNPDTDFHDMVAEITGLERSAAKEIGLGLSYKMGGAKLSRKLGHPTKWKRLRSGRMLEIAGPAGQAVLDQFDRKLPFIRQLAELAESRAQARGWIRTVLGRICRFPIAKDRPGYDWTSKALNRLIQGSSADQTKRAMLDCYLAGVRLQLQVHDELDLTIWTPSEATLVAEIMRTAVPASIPFTVTTKTGPNWGDMTKWKD